MTPYFQNEFVTLYHGDCGMIDIQHDLLIVDPPNKEFESGKAGGKWGQISGVDDPMGTTARLAHVLKGLKRARHVYIFEGLLDLSKLPLCAAAELVWDKGMIGMGDLASPWGPQHETILFAVYELSRSLEGAQPHVAGHRRRHGGSVGQRPRSESNW